VPRHLQLAIRNDEELGKVRSLPSFLDSFSCHLQLLGSVVISQGGVVPHIDPSLLPTGTKSAPISIFRPHKLTCFLQREKALHRKKCSSSSSYFFWCLNFLQIITSISRHFSIFSSSFCTFCNIILYYHLLEFKTRPCRLNHLFVQRPFHAS
jgi:hypothetical protein